MSVSLSGGAAPTSVTVVGGSDGTSARALKMNTDGTVVTDGTGGRTIKFAAISVASSGNNTILAAVTGKKITVLGYVLIADSAVTAKWQDGAGGTDLSGAMSLAANGGVSVANGGLPVLQGSTSTLLNMSLGGAAGVRGHLVYYEA